MSSGEIKRLGGGGSLRPKPTVLGQHEIPEGDPQVLDKNTKTEGTPAEVRVHEEIIVEGQDKIRRRISDSSLDLRFRQAKNREAWNQVKRLEDE